MAITHFAPQIIGRAEGRSAVLAAAYRHCAKMDHEAEARIVDYSAKRGLAHEEFLLPADAPEWSRALIADKSVAGAAEAFWNKVEAYETRADAQLAKEFIIALPAELTQQQNIALMRQFVFEHVMARGQVADWAYHDDPGNPHVHLMTTLRPLSDDGFGPKKVLVTDQNGQPIRTEAGKLRYRLWAGEKSDFLHLRQAWLDLQNQHLALAGLDIRVDGRSYAERGIDLVPTAHIGAAAKAMERKNACVTDLDRLTEYQATRDSNGRRIQENPEIVLDLITSEKSVFDERDIAKVLHRYIDDPGAFRSLLIRIIQSPRCLRLDVEHIDLATGVRIPPKFTTRDMVRIESEMINRARSLYRVRSHAVRENVLRSVLARHDRLSIEQKTAILHLVGNGRIAAVVGRAGAGKTTMMKAAREAWEAGGFRVAGAALAGKAAEGLQVEAGIDSRTLAAWELAWQQGRALLDERTIFVLDEAGMVASRQMASFVQAISRAGAKLVLVGDAEQLQPIEAGAPFRAIVERIGYVELNTIHRQRIGWMRAASMDLATGRIGVAIGAYDRGGMVHIESGRKEAIAKLVTDWHRDYDPDRPSLILAYLRKDVRLLNQFAREKRIEGGFLKQGSAFRTEDGERWFSAGDRVVFLRNEISLGVKNGMLGTVIEAAPGRIVAEIGEGSHKRTVAVDQRFYCNVDHGYATTIHKSQGATVDDVRLLASRHMDRHLTYVALTRHRASARLYVAANEFTKRHGVLIDHGLAPFENDSSNHESYFVTLQTGAGKQSTIWGIDFKRAITAAKARSGDRIGLVHKGSEKVRLPDERQVDRNIWEVMDVRTLVVSRLIEQMSRYGSKETTLDYIDNQSIRQILRFAVDRGLRPVRVARTLVRDRLAWIICQKHRLTEIAKTLRGLGVRLGLFDTWPAAQSQASGEPLVRGVTSFAVSFEGDVERKLQSDPVLTRQWKELSSRIGQIYADPEVAFRAMRFEAALTGERRARERLKLLEKDPHAFGKLRGREGVLIARSEREDRQVAKKNVPALRRDVERYLLMHDTALKEVSAAVRAERMRVSADIPALSPKATSVFEAVRNATGQDQLSAALEMSVADPSVKAEIDAFNNKVSERFGERTFLAAAAKNAQGPIFDHAARGLSTREKERLTIAWPMMRAGQQLASYERTARALTEVRKLQQSQRQSLK